jgi:hypothetical protein
MQEDGKAWSGRFAEPIDALTQRFNASVDFDRRLAEFDIQGSLAHARMLARAKILSAEDLASIERISSWIAGARGRPPQHRGAPHRAGGRRRQAAPHRPFAQ